MTRRTLLALCCTGLLSVPVFAGDELKTPACCVKKVGKETTEKAGKLRCSLTGKVVEKCCCVKGEGGKLHCTLAKQDVEKCCCTEVKAQGKEASGWRLYRWATSQPSAGVQRGAIYCSTPRRSKAGS